MIAVDHGITNLNGEVSFTTNINENSSFYCLYYGTGDYNPCSSNEISVEYQSYLYAPLLDGTESKYQLTGTTTIANGEMTGGSAYLTDGWDNTGNWKLTCEIKVNPDTQIQIVYPNTTRRDYNVFGIVRFGSNSIINSYVGSRETLISNINTIPSNTWIQIEIVKTSSSTMNVKIDGVSYNNLNNSLLGNSRLCIGVDKWSTANSSLRNILVEAI